MNSVDQYLARKLNERAVAGNLRQLDNYRAPIDFYSNDYLGFATLGILSAQMQPLAGTGQATGSTGSRLLSGNSCEAEILENTIAAFHKSEAALLFNSGYDANVGLLASIAGKDAVVLTDELCHASIIDGVRMSLCTKKYKFRHNDADDLERKLKRCQGMGPMVVVTESVYSMDGDMAPLTYVARLCEEYDARLIVDEAHATGVIGAHGEGLVCQAGLADKVFARVHTFGKALGCHGAAVVGSHLLKQYLINFARSFIYTTALPGHSIHAIQCAYEYMSGHSFSNEPLHELIAYFRSKVSSNDGWKESPSQIQALIVGDNERCKQIAAKVQRAGMQVNAILRPTVGPGMERLRVCLHSFNTKEQVDLLFENLQTP